MGVGVGVGAVDGTGAGKPMGASSRGVVEKKRDVIFAPFPVDGTSLGLTPV